jgi:hypothetical protein
MTNKGMQDLKYTDPQGWRYCDHPRPGSIYRLPDIPQLVRGPTLVLLPSGKEIQVPRMAKMMFQCLQSCTMPCRGKLQDLLKMLTAKQGPSAPAGFKTEARFLPARSRPSASKPATRKPHGDESRVLKPQKPSSAQRAVVGA